MQIKALPKKNLPVFAPEPPSEAFNSGSAGIRRECPCGRVTFNFMDSALFDNGELDRLERAAKKDPDKYIGVDYSVGTLMINGSEWVTGCPCNFGAKIEAWLLAHSQAVAEYLNAAADDLEKTAIKRAAAMRVKNKE